MIGFFSLLLLGAFSLLYISASWTDKPGFINKAVAFLSENIKKLSLIGVGYGLFAIIVVPLTRATGMEIIITLLANILIVLMALPYAFEHIMEKLGDRANPTVRDESYKLISWISTQGRLVGIVGCVFTLLLFGFVFR